MTEQVTKRHPIRGFIWGIFFGLGLALIAIGQGYAALGTLTPVILVIVGIVIGTLWGLFAPAKKPKGAAPPEPVQVEKVEPSRFDDFADSPTAPVAPVPEPVEAPSDVAAEAAGATDQAPKPDTSVFDAPQADPPSADPADPAGPAASTDPADPAASDDD